MVPEKEQQDTQSLPLVSTWMYTYKHMFLLTHIHVPIVSCIHKQTDTHRHTHTIVPWSFVLLFKDAKPQNLGFTSHLDVAFHRHMPLLR